MKHKGAQLWLNLPTTINNPAAHRKAAHRKAAHRKAAHRKAAHRKAAHLASNLVARSLNLQRNKEAPMLHPARALSPRTLLLNRHPIQMFPSNGLTN